MCVGVISTSSSSSSSCAKSRTRRVGVPDGSSSNGSAPIVFHQISEIRPVKGVTLVGPLWANLLLWPVEYLGYDAYFATGEVIVGLRDGRRLSRRESILPDEPAGETEIVARGNP